MNKSIPTAYRLAYRPCVGILLFNNDGEVFVGKRKINISIGEDNLWQYPQGGIDAGETPYAAALRELEEESGVAAHNVEFIYELPYWLAYELPHELQGKALKGGFCGQKQKYFALRLIGDDSAISLDTHSSPEFDEYKWSNLRECARGVVEFKRDIYQHLAEKFSHLENK